MIRRLAASSLACALLSQSPAPATGTVQGVAFTADADGGRSVLPDTKDLAGRPESCRNSVTPEGKFVLGAIAGSYTITAQAPGMTATQNIEVGQDSFCDWNSKMGSRP